MPQITFRFQIYWLKLSSVASPQTDSLGLELPSAQEVESLSLVAGIQPEQNEIAATLKVELPEGDPRLNALIATIKERYGFQPSRWNIIPPQFRAEYYGVRRMLSWSKVEVDAAELLWFRPKHAIAHCSDPTFEEWLAEDLAIHKDTRQSSKVQCGACSPVPAIFVAEPLKTQLEKSGLRGLKLKPTPFRGKPSPPKKPLWAVKSSLIMPRTVTPIVLGGEKYQWDYSATLEAMKQVRMGPWFERGGLGPPCPEYRRSEVEALLPFDIAEGAERIGLLGVRWACVSQKFKALMDEAKVAADYWPVELVDD